MDGCDPTPTLRVRMSLAERKRETRDALLLAALDTFSRVGYHAASLEAIANEAGFSKGAVYSNFSGKAELFLAVMDYNLEVLRGEDWDPLAADAADTCDAADAPDMPDAADTSAATETTGAAHPSGRDTDVTDADPASDPQVPEGSEADAVARVRGMSLASLEFIATAVRDDALSQALHQRVQAMVDAYERPAAAGRPADETLPVDDVARLMAALEQGVAFLALAGISAMDGDLMRAGLRRLRDPASAAREPATGRGARTSQLPEVKGVQRLIQDLADR